MNVAEAVEKSGQVVVCVECEVCAPGEPTRRPDCGNCDGSGFVEDVVPIAGLVAFILEHVPARESVLDEVSMKGPIEELRKTLREAVGRANARRATEIQRQDAARTASEAAQAIVLLRQAAG